KTINLTVCIILPEFIEYLIHLFLRQVLVIIKTDLHHRCRAAASEALDHRNGEFAVWRCLSGFNAEFAADVISYIGLAHHLAGKFFTYLNMMAPHGPHIQH